MVALRPSSRWSWALRLRSGRRTTCPPRANRRPSTSIACSPRTSASDSAAGSVTVTRPCSAMMSSGVALTARSIIVRTAGSASAISSRSSSLSASTCRSSASSISVESNRLPRLSGASCGWSGSMIAAPSTASSSGLARTGKMLTFAHVMTAVATSSSGLIGEAKRPPAAQRTTTCVESSEDAIAVVRSSPSATSVVFSTAHGHAVQAAEVLGRQPRVGGHGAERDVGLARSVEVDPVRLPGHEAVHARREPLGPDRDALQLHPLVRVRAAGGVGGRVHDPERRRRRVLRRARRVGVELVALPEQGVDELVEVAHRRAALRSRCRSCGDRPRPCARRARRASPW